MKERPILFQGAMVRALLAGTKTQTRRAVKPQPDFDTARVALGRHAGDDKAGYDPMFCSIGLRDGAARGFVQPNIACPYGRPGDRLWVRESTRSYFLPNLLTGEPTNALCGQYTADDEPVLNEHEFDLAWWYSRKSCPSIHMPRWACRLLLDVTAVRVERLQDISEADAETEGVDFLRHAPDADESLTARQLYCCLWDAINGAGSWDANPWVWVVAFNRAVSLPMHDQETYEALVSLRLGYDLNTAKENQ